MKVVIDIPEEHYEYIQNLPHYKRNYAQDLILDGTPLPKGHGRLIEVSKELECELWTYTRYTGIDEAPYEDATKALELAPTIIEAESEEV